MDWDFAEVTWISISVKTFVSFVALYLTWILFIRPVNIIQGLEGYKAGENNGLKRYLINKARKMQKSGDLPPPYPNSWYAILESDQLSAGQVKQIFVLGQTLVAWRGKQSAKVFVSNPYCPHLGAHLSQGQVSGDCIQCPFHLWSFSGQTGHVTNIPYSNTKNLENLPGLELWPVVETNGYIFIWHHAQAHSPTWSPEPIPEVTSGQWKYRGRSEFWTTCHIQEIPENGADVAHLHALHELPAMPYGAGLLSKMVKHEWTADWQPNPRPNYTHQTILTVCHNLKLQFFGFTRKLLHVQVNAKQIGAGLVTMQFDTPLGRGIFIQTVTPIQPLVQRITHRFYSEARFIQPLATLLLYAEGIQIGRDVEIWNRKCYLRKPGLVKEDKTIKLFRRWFSQFYSESDDYDVSVERQCNSKTSYYEENKLGLDF